MSLVSAREEPKIARDRRSVGAALSKPGRLGSGVEHRPADYGPGMAEVHIREVRPQGAALRDGPEEEDRSLVELDEFTGAKRDGLANALSHTRSSQAWPHREAQ